MSLSHEVRVLNAESDLAWARSRPEELEKSIVADRQLKEEMSAAAAKAIKAESSATTTCDAKDLQLFLAKKDGGAGAWLTEKDVKEGVSDSDTSDLELLDVAGAPLNLVGLSVEDVRFQVTKEDVKAGTVPVHVLVMVPDGAGGSASETSASS
ncbi:hypothetical protein PC112_g12794 [Phytophthora cactorum]|nr:hypothetical protein PC112_g12794 [Phytophthora cactorum]